MRKFSAVVLTLSLAMLAGCSNDPKGAVDNSKPIIQVNNDRITKNMFDKTLDTAYKSSFLAARNIDLKDPNNRFIYLMFVDQVVKELITRDLIDQEAGKRNLKVSEDEVNKKYEEIAKNVGGTSKLEANLVLGNIQVSDYKESLRKDLLVQKLVNSVAVGVNTPDSEVQKFYNDNKATKFTNPDLVRAEHILFKVFVPEIKEQITAQNPTMSAAEVDKKIQAEVVASKAKAQMVLSQLKANPAKFEELAKQYSGDTNSAQKGGDLGYFSEKQMVPSFAKVAFNLLPGNISDIVETQYGFHIIKVLDRKKAGVTPFVEVKDEIKNYLTNQKKIFALQKLIEASKGTAKIVYVDPQYDPNAVANEIKQISKKKQKGLNLPLQQPVAKQGK